VLFSDELSVRFLKKVLCEPAFGMVLKNCKLSEIRTALDRALDGRIYVCAQVRELLSASGHGKVGEGGPLTATEREILREIVLGRSAKEIAARRGMSVSVPLIAKINTICWFCKIMSGILLRGLCYSKMGNCL
jgi:DNA-binding NarL/FixJ family response regulator